MVEESLMVKLKNGLHARPATEFVKSASSFTSDITVTKGTKRVNAKSIMGILSLGIAFGEEIILAVNGTDELNALAVLKQMITNEEE
ncbi:MAG: HPr family phosphocarrier protein [Desulfitobacteriaceae bacterium]